MSWLDRLKSGLKKSSEKLDISGIFTKKKLDQETLDNLEESLIMADLGLSVAEDIIKDLAKEKFDKEISEKEIKDFLAQKIATIIEQATTDTQMGNESQSDCLNIYLMVGVNGSGKTTTIGKLAKKFADTGKKVKIAACDTFRAAAIDQIKVWADRADVDILSAEPGSDAAALAYKAVEESLDDNTDILFIDTAGRLQNKSHLMEELAKIKRVIKKAGGDKVTIKTLLVIDATTGQNALSQAEIFKESVDISGLVMTKLDGSAKGGVLVNIVSTHHLPVHYIGVGESAEDLQEFNAKDFATKLVGL